MFNTLSTLFNTAKKYAPQIKDAYNTARTTGSLGVTPKFPTSTKDLTVSGNLPPSQTDYSKLTYGSGDTSGLLNSKPIGYGSLIPPEGGTIFSGSTLPNLATSSISPYTSSTFLPKNQDSSATMDLMQAPLTSNSPYSTGGSGSWGGTSTTGTPTTGATSSTGGATANTTVSNSELIARKQAELADAKRRLADLQRQKAMQNTTNNTTNTTTNTGYGSIPTYNPQDNTQYGLIQQLLEQGKAKSGEIADLRDRTALALGQQENRAIPIEFKSGRANVMQNLSSQREQALAQELGNIQSIYGTAIGAKAPQAVPYGTQYVDPTTGRSILGGASGAGGGYDPMNPMNSLPSLVDDVIGGRMTIDSANALLENPALQRALRQGILEKAPGFNFLESSASAGTVTQGQQMETAAQPAYFALDEVQHAYNNLGAFSSSNIPFISTKAQEISMATGLGRNEVSAYLGALNEARAKIAAVLATSIGVEGAGAQANTLLPDGMTPSEVPAKLAAAKAYIEQQVQTYKTSGIQDASYGGGGGGTWDW